MRNRKLELRVVLSEKKMVGGGKETRCGFYVKGLCARLGMTVFPYE